MVGKTKGCSPALGPTSQSTKAKQERTYWVRSGRTLKEEKGGGGGPKGENNRRRYQTVTVPNLRHYKKRGRTGQCGVGGKVRGGGDGHRFKVNSTGVLVMKLAAERERGPKERGPWWNDSDAERTAGHKGYMWHACQERRD